MTRRKLFILFLGLFFFILIFSFNKNAYSEKLTEAKRNAYREWKILGFQLLNESIVIENIYKTITYDIIINSSHVINMSSNVSPTLKEDILGQDNKLKDYQQKITLSESDTFLYQLLGLEELDKAVIKNILLSEAIHWEGQLTSNLVEISSNLLRDEIDFNSSFSHFLALINQSHKRTSCLAISAILVSEGLKTLIEIAPRNSRKDRLKVREKIEKARNYSQFIFSKDSANECATTMIRNFCNTHSIKGSKEYFRIAAQALLTSFNESYGVLMHPLPTSSSPGPDPKPELIERRNLRTAAYIELSALRDLIIESIGANSECAAQKDILQ